MSNNSSMLLRLSAKRKAEENPQLEVEAPFVQPQVEAPFVQPQVSLNSSLIERLSARRQADVGTDVDLSQPTPPTPIAEEAARLPEMTKNFFDDPRIAGALLFSSSDKGKIDIIKKVYNLPDEAIRTDKNGITIVDFPDGTSRTLNKPNFSYQDAVEFVGQTIAQIPATLLTAATPGGFLPRAAVGALTSGITEYGLQKGSQSIGSEQPVSPLDVGLASAFGVIGEGAETVIKRGSRKRLKKRIGVEKVKEFTSFPENVAAAKKIEKTIAPFGKVRTFRPQKTGYIKDLLKGQYASMMSEKAQKQLMKQNTEVKKVFSNFIESISPANTYPEAAEKMKKTAGKLIENLKEQRRIVAKKIYDEAQDVSGRYVLPETVKKIQEILISYPPKGRPPKIKNFLNVLTTPTKNGLQPDAFTVTQLHKLKAFRLEDLIKKADPKNKIELNEIKTVLLKEIETISPKYKQARLTYEAFSKPVNQIEESLIGDAANLKNKQLKSLKRILNNPDDYYTSPKEINRMRKAFKDEDPATWNSFVGSFFEDKILTKMGSLADEEKFLVPNIPAQIERALIGKGGKEKNLMMSLLDGEKKKNFTYLLEGLKMWKQMRPGGSQTALWEQIKKEMKSGGIGGWLSRLFTPRYSAKETVEQINMNHNVKAVVTALFDPKWEPSMKDLRRFNPNSNVAGLKFKRIVEKIAKTLPKPISQAARPKTEN